MVIGPNAAPLRPSRLGVLVVDAWRVDLVVEDGQLVVRAITGRDRREGRFARATSQLRRVLVRSVAGYASWQALDWLDGIGARLIRVDTDGRPSIASTRLGRDDPALRRAQAGALGTKVGMAIARDLLGRKLRGQATIVRERGFEEAGCEIERAIRALPAADSPAELLVPEASAAATFWTALSTTPLTWARADTSRVPAHWRSVGPRTSPLTGSPRAAAAPAQAIWGYAYAVGEIAARIACTSVGLDPSLGLLHRDLRSRSSLALDCLEAIRPDIDRVVLELIERRTFRRADFVERPNGTVRLMSPLAGELAQMLPVWEARLGPVVEAVARAIARGSPTFVRSVPTPLTGANRSAGRDGVRRRTRSARPRTVRVGATCRTCGEALPTAGRIYCDSCLPESEAEQRAASLDAAHRRLAADRAAERDRSHGGDAAARRGRKVAASRRAVLAWERSDGPAPDPELFRREVLPHIQAISAARLAALTGLSRGYCAAIRRGVKAPHPRWWSTLLDLSGSKVESVE